ncbi:MAG: sialidase family protein [Gammaproteobacteria bacterium]
MAAFGFYSLIALAADPQSGTLSDSSPELSYSSGPFLVSNPVGITANGEPDCADPVLPCDDFALTVELPAGFVEARPTAEVRIAVSWENPAEDYDIFLYDADGAVVRDSASSANPEIMTIPASDGSTQYTVRIVPYAAAGGSTSATITLEAPPPGEEPPLPPAATGLAPRFAYHQSPPGLADGAGEPTIGFNPLSKNVMYIAALETDRVSFAENSALRDAAGNPLPESCDATWEDVSYAAHVNTLDPILHTEQSVGRTFSTQLSGANSIFAYSDDDGENWTPGQIGPPNGGVDHQTVGSGPYAEGFEFGLGVDYAVYYCSQSVAAAFCARSDDGGQTFGPGIPIYQPTIDCEGGSIGGLHGHVQVGADGTVYVPFGGCGATQAVSVSEDSGLTWTVKPVPQSEPGDDPGVGVASDGSVYFCYINGTGSPHVTVSKDKGETWINDYDIGARTGIKHAVFPTAVAGDGDRAACAFLGTRDEGNPGRWTSKASGIRISRPPTTAARPGTPSTCRRTIRCRAPAASASPARPAAPTATCSTSTTSSSTTRAACCSHLPTAASAPACRTRARTRSPTTAC